MDTNKSKLSQNNTHQINSAELSSMPMFNNPQSQTNIASKFTNFKVNDKNNQN